MGTLSLLTTQPMALSLARELSLRQGKPDGKWSGLPRVSLARFFQGFNQGRHLVEIHACAGQGTGHFFGVFGGHI